MVNGTIGREWSNKTTFLHRVTGNGIVQENDKINQSPNMFVVATVPQMRWCAKELKGQVVVVPETEEIEGEKAILYDCHIYFKVRESVGNIVIPEDTFDGKSKPSKK